MRTPNLKYTGAVVVTAALLAACGGQPNSLPAAGSGPSTATVPSTAAEAPGDIATSVTALLNYVRQLLTLDANGDPADVNATALAVDDKAEPDPVTF